MSKKNIKETVVIKAMDMASQQGWAQVTLADIAAECDMAIADLYDHFEDKTDILVALGRIIDRKVLDSIGDPDPEISTRDRLFDILMERFEALNEYRSGMSAVLDSFYCDPKQAVISLPHLCRSMTWMLEASGVNADGISGAVKLAGMTGVYLKVLKTWKEDESLDLSKTMAALDKDLGRVEKLAGMLGF